jgi:hypothetical protein
VETTVPTTETQQVTTTTPTTETLQVTTTTPTTTTDTSTYTETTTTTLHPQTTLTQTDTSSSTSSLTLISTTGTSTQTDTTTMTQMVTYNAGNTEPLDPFNLSTINGALLLNLGLFAVLPIVIGLLTFFIMLKAIGEQSEDPTKDVLTALFTSIIIIIMTEICVYIAVYAISVMPT